MNNFKSGRFQNIPTRYINSDDFQLKNLLYNYNKTFAYFAKKK